MIHKITLKPNPPTQYQSIKSDNPVRLSPLTTDQVSFGNSRHFKTSAEMKALFEADCRQATRSNTRKSPKELAESCIAYIEDKKLYGGSFENIQGSKPLSEHANIIYNLSIKYTRTDVKRLGDIRDYLISILNPPVKDFSEGTPAMLINFRRNLKVLQDDHIKNNGIALSKVVNSLVENYLSDLKPFKYKNSVEDLDIRTTLEKNAAGEQIPVTRVSGMLNKKKIFNPFGNNEPEKISLLTIVDGEVYKPQDISS